LASSTVELSAAGVFLQEARVLPELRRTPHGRECAASGGGGDDGLDALRMRSITYRIATGAQAGRKVATLQTIPADNGSPEGDAGKVGGFSLRASPPRRTRARSWNACAGTLRARRSARSAYRSRRRAGCGTSSSPRGETARRTWSLSRWS